MSTFETDGESKENAGILEVNTVFRMLIWLLPGPVEVIATKSINFSIV